MQRCAVEQVVERPGGHRHHVVEVPEREVAAVAVQLDVPRFNLATVVVAQNRDQDHVVELGVGRLPVDVEVGGEVARLAVFEDIPPPAVVAAGNAHVVGDNVEDLPQARSPQRLAEPSVPLDPAQLVVRLGMIEDVVAVGAPLAGLKIRRRIQVRDPQSAEVIRHLGRVVEAKFRPHLHTIRRQWDGHRHSV